MKELADALKSINLAWSNGRLIVPLIGAGFSVDSGMPVVQGIEAYLAQLHIYLKDAVYLGLDRSDDLTKTLFKDVAEDYRLHPDRFVRDLQWPDRFVLHQQLCRSNVWDHLARGGEASRQTMHDLGPATE